MKFAYKNKWLILTGFIWIILFCTPPLRHHLRAWYSGSPWLKFTLIPNDYWDARFNEQPRELPLRVTSIKKERGQTSLKHLMVSTSSGSYALQLFRSSLASWICTASVLVLIVLIGQTVLDNRLQPWADNQLRGEMHLLHDVQDSPH